jgi:hypothetical protein
MSELPPAVAICNQLLEQIHSCIITTNLLRHLSKLQFRACASPGLPLLVCTLDKQVLIHTSFPSKGNIGNNFVLSKQTNRVQAV